MDSFEFNKMIGALLGLVFAVFSVGIVSDALFASPVPEKPGYHIEAVEEGEAGGATEGGGDEQQPIAAMLASANVEAGQASFKKCAACHTGEQGGPNKVGPNLWSIVNRPIASHEGFAYSAPMKAFAETAKIWDYEHLDQFLLSPKGTVKGTAMGFAGLKKPDERANVIAYLRTLSDAPAPLPEAAAPAAEKASAPAAGSEAAQPAAEGTEAAQPGAQGTEATPAPADPAPGGNGAAAPAPANPAPDAVQPAPGATENAAPEGAPPAAGPTQGNAPTAPESGTGGASQAAPTTAPDAAQPAPGATDNAAPKSTPPAAGATQAPAQPAQ